MSVINSPYYVKTMEEAVKNYPYPEERQGLIDRHNTRMQEVWRDKCAGLFTEKTGGNNE